MNWIHLKATIWLRWRILVNRVRRTSKLNNAVLGLLIVLGVCASMGLFALALLIGLAELDSADPMHLMLIWVGLAVGFLFFWMIGLLADLQRADAMSFKNLLHLPVSLRWVFLYNYLSSFVSVTAAIFLPAMIGLCLAMVIVHGPLMLFSFPLVLGFFGMITALTYQLRGWLAHLMENKRRGRNIVAVITVVFIVLIQTPNLINLGLHRSSRHEGESAVEEQVESESGSEIGVGGTSTPDPAAVMNEIKESNAAIREQQTRDEATLDRYVSAGAMIIPVGWLPYGVRAASEGRWFPSVLCALGMLGIATWSLRRSFRTTMASVVGLESGRAGVAILGPKPGTRVVRADERKTLLVERRLPFVSERVAGIAFGSLRSLLRAPEAKMLLLSPLILVGLFIFMLATNPMLDKAATYGPLMSLGVVAMGLLSIAQLTQNHFGLDRDGFRTYVLSPVPRHQILAGKNLGMAPIGLGIGLTALIALEFFVVLDLSHFLGACLQLISAYLLLSLYGNALSIDAPMRLKEHGLKAANAKLQVVILHMISLVLIPVILSPLLIPYVVELVVGGAAWARFVPVYLLLHVAEFLVVAWFYRWMIRRQGEHFQSREEAILEVLTRD